MFFFVKEMPPFEPPVPTAAHAPLAIILCSIGFAVMAYFFAIQSTTQRSTDKNIVKEIVLAVISSTLLGVGFVFLFLSVGLYV